MKLKYLYTIFFFGIVTSFPSIAQDWTTAGNTTTGTEWLGTLTTQPLEMRTNNIERMRLTPTGNLGINTTNPISLLHVNNGATVWVEQEQGFRARC